VSWDPYLDLQSGVLRNRLGITDAAELAHAEAELTSYRRRKHGRAPDCKARVRWRAFYAPPPARGHSFGYSKRAENLAERSVANELRRNPGQIEQCG
jgi:hypothetical protein